MDCISRQVILKTNVEKKEEWEEEGACSSCNLDQACVRTEWQTGATGNSPACKPSMSEHNGHTDLMGEQWSMPTDPWIPHQTQKQNDLAHARVAVDAERCPAFSLPQRARCVGGWGGPIHGESRGGGAAHEMKYVQAGCDCPTSVNLICTSSLLPGYATMKSISMILWHQSLRLPSGWPACSCTNTLKKRTYITKRPFVDKLSGSNIHLSGVII